MRIPTLVIVALLILARLSAAAEVAPRAHRNEKALAILRQATEAWRAIREEDADKQLIARQIAEAQARAGDVASALAVSLTDPVHRSALLARVAGIQAQHGEVKDAFRVADSLTNIEDKVEALLGIAKAHLAAGRKDDALSAFREAEEEGFDVSSDLLKMRIFKRVAEVQYEVGDWASAYRAARLMPDSADKADMLSMMAKDLIAKENVKGASQIALEIPDEKTRDVVYRAIAEAQAEKGDTVEALRTSDSIVDDFYRASAYSWIGAAQHKKGETAEGRKTLQNAQRTARGMEETSRDKALLLVSVGRALWKADLRVDGLQSIQEARRCAHQIPIDPSGARSLALQEVGDALVEVGQAQAAQEAYQEARRTLSEMNARPYDRASQLIEIARSLQKAGHDRDALHTMQEASQVARLVEDGAEKCDLLLEVSVMQAKFGEFDTAQELLEAAERTSAAIKDETARLAVSISVALTRLRLGYVKAALEAMYEMREEGDRAEVLSRITAEQTQTGQGGEAYELALSQKTALLKTKALLGVANGLLDADDRVGGSTFTFVPQEEEQESDEPVARFSSREGEEDDYDAPVGMLALREGEESERDLE